MNELITAYVGIRWESGMDGIFRLEKKTNWYFLCSPRPKLFCPGAFMKFRERDIHVFPKCLQRIFTSFLAAFCNYFTTLSNLAISKCNHYWKRNIFGSAAPPPTQVHNSWTYQLGPLISVISLAVGNKGLI